MTELVGSANHTCVVCFADQQRPSRRPVTDSFTHLHVHTEFSMLDGAARLDEMVAKAVADGQPAIGMTDHGNMYGTLEFYREAITNIRPRPTIASRFSQNVKPRQ